MNTCLQLSYQTCHSTCSAPVAGDITNLFFHRCPPGFLGKGQGANVALLENWRSVMLPTPHSREGKHCPACGSSSSCSCCVLAGSKSTATSSLGRRRSCLTRSRHSPAHHWSKEAPGKQCLGVNLQHSALKMSCSMEKRAYLGLGTPRIDSDSGSVPSKSEMPFQLAPASQVFYTTLNKRQ